MPIVRYCRSYAALAALLLVSAGCADNPVATTASVVDGPVSLIVVSGGGQSALANTELSNALVVRVNDAKGHPVRDQLVNFRVVEGGGSVYAGSSMTNHDGIAQEWWTLGASGPQSVEVRAVDPTSGAKQRFATFTATITVPPPPPPPAINPDGFEPNDLQGLANPISTLFSGQSVTISPNFHTLTDVDWFRFNTIDGGAACVPGSTENFVFTAALSNVPAGSTYAISLFQGSTPVVTLSAAAGETKTIIFNFSGTCGVTDDQTLDIKVDRLTGDPTASTYSVAVSYNEN